MLMEPVKTSTIIKAIELRISECFGAMLMANALGGRPSPEWDLVRRVGLDELVADALDRKVDVRQIRAAVDKTAFMDTPAYRRVKEMIGGRPDFPV